MAKSKRKGVPQKGTPKQSTSNTTRLALAATILNLVTGLIGLINKLIEIMNK